MPKQDGGLEFIIKMRYIAGDSYGERVPYFEWQFKGLGAWGECSEGFYSAAEAQEDIERFKKELGI